MKLPFSRTAAGGMAAADRGMSRCGSLDVMKCLAAFCVVWIHFGEGLAPLVRWAVPLFFIITGYYYPAMVERGKFRTHLRKLVVMTLCSSMLYALVAWQHEMRQGTLGQWLFTTFQPRSVAGNILLGNDMFGLHLWFLYAVVYDLILFRIIDKLGFTRCGKFAAPLLLLAFLVGNFTPQHPALRNFLFFGFPCMWIGRSIREGTDRPFSFLGNPRYLWLFAIGSALMSYGEMRFLGLVCPHGNREMYAFTLPMLLPFFYCALRHPGWGSGSLLATIGRKHSANIYIIHVVAASALGRFVDFGTSCFGAAIRVLLVFLFSLMLSRLFVRAKETLEKKRREQAPGRMMQSQQRAFWLRSREKDIKKGIPLYPNLVNLKSNTMKNTVQRYGKVRKAQEGGPTKWHLITYFRVYARKMAYSFCKPSNILKEKGSFFYAKKQKERGKTSQMLYFFRKFAPMKNHQGTLRRLVRWLLRFRHRCGYGIHSPFAFNLVTGVVYESGNYYAYEPLSRWRSGQPDPLREKDDRLLLRLANANQPASCLVFGKQTDVAQRYLRAGCRKCRIVAVPQAGASLLLDAAGGEQSVGMAYIAPEAPALAALDFCLPRATDRTLVVVAGIHTSPHAAAAWKRLVDEPKARVTFDLYDFGLAFFESRLNKQAYVVNYF